MNAARMITRLRRGFAGIIPLFVQAQCR